MKMAGRLRYMDILAAVPYEPAGAKLCVLRFLFLNVSDVVSLRARCWQYLMRVECVILLVLLFSFFWCFCITNHIQASYCSPRSFLPVRAYIELFFIVAPRVCHPERSQRDDKLLF